MHKSRFVSLVLAAAAMAMTLVFVIQALRKPDLVPTALLFAPLFGFVSGMAVLSACLPNSWYRHRERVMKRHENVA